MADGGMLEAVIASGGLALVPAIAAVVSKSPTTRPSATATEGPATTPEHLGRAATQNGR